MNAQATPHVSIHPLRMAFFLNAGWFWYRWWEREALLAMQALERQWTPVAGRVAGPIVVPVGTPSP